jgi:hypothetical protein
LPALRTLPLLLLLSLSSGASGQGGERPQAQPIVRPPKHKITLRFLANEIPTQPVDQNGLAWTILAQGQESVYTFDSSTAQRHEEKGFFENHVAQQGVGRCWYAHLDPTPEGHPERSLRVLWWEVAYPNGHEWIAGAVLNEALEGPIGRLRGRLIATLDDGKGVFVVPSATMWDETGCVFEFGHPEKWVDLERYAWYQNRFRSPAPVPPNALWTPVPCPDVQGGARAWQPQWTPFSVNLKRPDGSWVLPKYWATSDPRNPPIGQLIGEVQVADWYAAQTHSHYREGSEGFRAPWETAFQAFARAGDNDGENLVLQSLWDRNKRQVGCQSPTNAGFIDGRPNQLATLDGALFVAGKRYEFTESDKAAPFTAILQEGKPQIGKSGYLFWQCFGREQMHFLDLVYGQFKGLYMGNQGSDFEHCAGEALLAGVILYGDPLAARQLHHICEEQCTKAATKLHSTRSDNGWKLATLLDGYLAFHGNSVYGADAERYRNVAFEVGAHCWQARYDETPYHAALTVGYEYQDQSVPEAQQFGYEATMQLAVALNATTQWYQVEPDASRKAFWLEFASYLFQCADQPGIIDWKRGGLIPRYSLQTPLVSPIDPRTASELVESYADPHYNRREGLADSGWLIDAIAEFFNALPQGELRTRAAAVAKAGYEAQGQTIIGSGNLTTFSVRNFSAYGQHYPCVQAFGWQP